MSHSKILIQLDPDPNPSTFDSVVAIDAGVDHLLTHGNVSVSNVQSLVHGAMFTRGPDDLKHTALFFGGSNVQVTEAIVESARHCFFGPLRVSLMSDPNGSNTTAAAAVLCAENHVELDGQSIVILAGTGPVGQRIAQIIARQNRSKAESMSIKICSREITKAAKVCQALETATESDVFQACQTANSDELLAAIESAGVVFAAGAAGIELLPEGWQSLKVAPQVAIDLNAVPPAGIAGVQSSDKATMRGETICYGAIGVGGLKMKIHKRCLASLFESNDRVLGVNEIYEIGRKLT